MGQREPEVERVWVDPIGRMRVPIWVWGSGAGGLRQVEGAAEVSERESEELRMAWSVEERVGILMNDECEPILR